MHIRALRRNVGLQRGGYEHKWIRSHSTVTISITISLAMLGRAKVGTRKGKRSLLRESKWARSKVGTSQSRHEPRRARAKVGTSQSGHEPGWARAKVGTGQGGHEPRRARAKVGTSQGGHEPRWARAKGGHGPGRQVGIPGSPVTRKAGRSKPRGQISL